MPKIDLLEELHSNTRRTRVTYKARLGDQLIALKCYRKPLYGLVHWWLAVRRGSKIRTAEVPFPAIGFSGWVGPQRCFGYGTVFLEGSRSLRDVLENETDQNVQAALIRKLGRTVAELHSRGIEQPDGNLTNFLLASDGGIYVVDEDDIRVCRSGMSLPVAMNNLGNIGARVPVGELVSALLDGYVDFFEEAHSAGHWDFELFRDREAYWRHSLTQKRASRNIAPRQFD